MSIRLKFNLAMFVVDPDGRELLRRPLPPGVRGALPDGGGLAARPPRPRGDRFGPRSKQQAKPHDRSGPPGGHRDRRFRPEPRILQGERGDYALFVIGLEGPGARWISLREIRGLFPVVLILISGVACLLLARYLTRPIRAFRAAGQRIAEGDLGARVGAPVIVTVGPS